MVTADSLQKGATMAKTILMIHGRHFKPPKEKLESLWLEALRWGIEKDHPDKLDAFDGVVAKDYREMKEWRLTRSVTDKRIYNLAVRDGKSNPHHGPGYLVRPYAAGVVAKWL